MLHRNQDCRHKRVGTTNGPILWRSLPLTEWFILHGLFIERPLQPNASLTIKNILFERPDPEKLLRQT